MLRTINFMGVRNVAFGVTVLLTVLALFSWFHKGLNYGLDFTGGTLIELTYEKPADLTKVRNELVSAGFHDAVVQSFGATTDLLVRMPGDDPLLGNKVAAALGADMLNIETLLIEKFLGFYNDKPSDIKNYIYIAWALWAYLVAKQKEVLAAHGDKALPFYGGIPGDVRAITLNYTAFLEQSLGEAKTIYFHGGLGDYVRMDTRDLLPVDQILECDPAQFIREVVAPNVDVNHDDIRQQRHVIPALVPPLRLKPILSHRYIELWSEASD